MAMLNSLDLLNSIEQKWLVECIRDAEKFSTGEIRIHLEDYSLKDTLDRAAEVFSALDMQKTVLRNGILIYVSAAQHGLAIIGDVGINQKVSPKFWDKELQLLHNYFSQKCYFEGLARITKNIGALLTVEFPIGDLDNPNELTDEISFG